MMLGATTRQSLLGGGAGFLEHIPAFSGDLWYVNGTTGNDANSGRSPEVPFATIGAALAVALAGDAITVAPGDYDEVGLDLALDGLELWCEHGTHILDSTPGTGLTISGDHCRVSGAHFTQAGAVGAAVTGDHAWLTDCQATGVTTAYDLDGGGAVLRNCTSILHTVAGFAISGAEHILFQCHSGGTGAATRGFYLDNAAADDCVLDRCSSINNGTAGYALVAGTEINTIRDCVSGFGDGLRTDLGQSNTWVNYGGVLEEQAHEEPWPQADGEGAAITLPSISSQANNATDAAATTQWYWGEPVVIIARDTITEVSYLLGFLVMSATANKRMQWEAFTGFTNYRSDRNAGNAWDEGATALTVDDGTPFIANDLVAIYSSVDVEIVRVVSSIANVVTIARETVNMATPNGLRWNHTAGGAGTEEMTLVHRPGDPRYHSTVIHYLTAAASLSPRWEFTAPRPVDANAFALVRIMNMTDAVDCTVELSAIIEE
jgi:hypothetical protein